MEKYAPLAEEIKRIWNQEKVIIIPLIIGATGTTPKTLTSHLQDLNIPSYILHNIQKATIINTCSIVRQLTKIHNITKTTEPYFIYKPQSVLENNDCKIYWDNPIITDKTIIANRPDITLTDKRNSITYLIDIAIPGDHNIEKKYKEKMEKYAPLAEEIKRIWNQEKVIIIPLIIGATGTTPKTLTSHLQDLNIPSYILHNIQKATIINTCSIVRRFLQ
ncbi:hypothetical protein M8J77_009472 [Diaphorina citri]|nr:hypothetical protein M8J77_009472 [Diaphorina citri]